MKELIDMATNARKEAYAPYSRFAVGAAVLTSNGKIYTGCNIENSSYGLTNCAERTAIFKAVSEGDLSLGTMAVVADTPGPTAPCGACRQVMAEFGIKTVIMCNTRGDKKVITLAELLPFAFGDQDLSGDGK
nr:cytidine deaminase [Anaerospora sp.]